MKTWLLWENNEPCYNSDRNCYDTSDDTASLLIVEICV